MQAAAITDAKKQPHGRADALALVQGMTRLMAAKGKRLVELDLTKNPSVAEIEALLLGPTGNLRAPTFRKGKTLVVGFAPEAYAKALKP